MRASIELNNENPSTMEFEMLGRNANVVNSEMKEKMSEMASGLDFGHDFELNTTKAQPVATWKPIDDLRTYVDSLEQVAAKQLDTLRSEGTFKDLDSKIPEPPTSP